MSSQRSFESTLGKFIGGLKVLKETPVYVPTKEQLKIAFLENLQADAETKNSNVVTTGVVLTDLRNERRFICFSAKDTDTNCLENLFRNIANFTKAEFSEKSPAFKRIYSILKRIKPPRDKKEETVDGQDPKKSKSMSEKSYEAMVGYGNEVHTIIANLGEAYSPTNTNITVENLRAKVDQLAGLNASIVKAESDYSKAVTERNEVYNGEVGIKNIIPLIKNYLASFEGGKNNEYYKSFVNAVK